MGKENEKLPKGGQYEFTVEGDKFVFLSPESKVIAGRDDVLTAFRNRIQNDGVEFEIDGRKLKIGAHYYTRGGAHFEQRMIFALIDESMGKLVGCTDWLINSDTATSYRRDPNNPIPAESFRLAGLPSDGIAVKGDDQELKDLMIGVAVIFFRDIGGIQKVQIYEDAPTRYQGLSGEMGNRETTKTLIQEYTNTNQKLWDIVGVSIVL